MLLNIHFLFQFTFYSIVKIYRLLTRGAKRNVIDYVFLDMYIETSVSLTKWERVNVTGRFVSVLWFLSRSMFQTFMKEICDINIKVIIYYFDRSSWRIEILSLKLNIRKLCFVCNIFHVKDLWHQCLSHTVYL